MLLSKNVTIGDTPTAIYRSTSNGCHVYLSLPKNGESVTLGSADVQFGVGLGLDAKADGANTINGMLPPGDTVYGICSTGLTQVIGVLVVED